MGDEEADGKAQVEQECDAVMERRRMKEGEIREQVDSWWHSGKRRWESVKEWRSGKWWMWQRTSRRWYKCSHFHACNNSNIAVHNVNCTLLCHHLHQCQTYKCPSPTRLCEFRDKMMIFFFFAGTLKCLVCSSAPRLSPLFHWQKKQLHLILKN